MHDVLVEMEEERVASIEVALIRIEHRARLLNKLYRRAYELTFAIQG